MFFYKISELFWQCVIFLQDFGTVLTVLYFLHVSVQGQESELSCICVLGVSVFASILGFYCMISELFSQCGIFLHDFGTALTVWYFSTWFRNCSDSVVFFYMSFYMISEQFWQCGIFLHDFGTALRALYFLKMFFYLISELFWQCGILLDDFRTALTVWYFSTWSLNCSDSVVFFNMISELFWRCIFPTWFRNCSNSVVFHTLFRSYSDSVVFFYMISELFWQCGISYIVSEFNLKFLYFSSWFRNCSDSVVFSDMIS